MHTKCIEDSQHIFGPFTDSEVGGSLFGSLLDNGESPAVVELRGNNLGVADPVVRRRRAEGQQAGLLGWLWLSGGQDDDAERERRKGKRTALQVVRVIIVLIAERVHDADVIATSSSLSAES